MRSFSLAMLFFAFTLVFSASTFGEVDKPIVNKELGFKISLPKRWDSQPLPPAPEYKRLGMKPKDIEDSKRVAPLLVYKGGDGSECRVLTVDEPDFDEALELVKVYAKTQRIKDLGQFKAYEVKCRKTKMKVANFTYSSWGGRVWENFYYVANNENGSFLITYSYLQGRKQYLKDIEASAKSFGYYKKSKPKDKDDVDERLDLPPGWKLYETAHYLIQYNETSDEKVKDFGKRIELLNKAHRSVIKPDPNLEQIRPNKQLKKFIIKYFKNHKGFQKYASDEGVRGAAAYYSPMRGEIAFYLSGWKKMTQGILYHECTHQYLHEFIGGPRVRFHIWINEGLAEYFNGAGQAEISKIIPGTRLKTAEQSVKRAIRDGSVLKLIEMINMSQREFYRIGRFAYDHGWGFVYFLLHSKNANYNSIIPKYFSGIQKRTFPV